MNKGYDNRRVEGADVQVVLVFFLKMSPYQLRAGRPLANMEPATAPFKRKRTVV